MSFYSQGSYEVRVEIKDKANSDKLVGCLDVKFDAVDVYNCPLELFNQNLN